MFSIGFVWRFHCQFDENFELPVIWSIRTRQSEFLSVDNWVILLNLSKKKFWNRLTLLNKILIFLRSLEEPFSGNSVKISDCQTCLEPASINYYYYYLCCHYCCCCYDFILPFNYWLSVSHSILESSFSCETGYGTPEFVECDKFFE